MSHSGAEALNPEQGRTVLLPDEILKALADAGGIIGVHFMSHFVKPTRAKAVVADLVRQFAYLTELVGSDHVVCSPDYMYVDPRTWENHGLSGTPFTYPYGLEDISGFAHVTRGMVQAGFSDDDILNILGRSHLAYFERVRKAAQPLPAEYKPKNRGIGTATEGTTPW
jgi:microsomal dipeptidase-like Zn-dependent dipeptidase